MKYEKIASCFGVAVFLYGGIAYLFYSATDAHWYTMFIGILVAIHHYLHYKHLLEIEHERETTARIVTMANDELARFNKQILLSPKDFDYHVMNWPCTKNTVVTEGKEYMWYGIKKNDTFVSIGGYRAKVVSKGSKNV